MRCSHRKISYWEYMIQKIKKRVSKWSSFKISIGGRLTLINSILSSLPVFLLSVFRAPKKILNDIVKLQRSFLLGGGERDKSISWVKWSEICYPKNFGGLGVKDLESFNLALLGKWLWRALGKRDSLWVKVITSRWGCNWRTGNFERGRKIVGWWGDILKSGD